MEVDDRPVKKRKLEYRFTFFFAMGGVLVNSSETIESIIKRADANEKEKLAKWARSAKPGDWKNTQEGFGLVVCNRAEGEGAISYVDVFPEDEGYDQLP